MLATYQRLLNRVKSDVSLLRAFSRGDASAFELLYSRYKDVLFNSLYHQLGGSNEAEEVAQEVWMAVIKGAESFEEKSADSKQGDSSSFKSWLFSIAHRRSADYWRKQYREKDGVQPGGFENQLAETADDSLAAQPEHQHLMHEFRQLLQKLPEDQRQSFILREEGFSYQEIAELTEVGVETVKSRLRYAKKTLKEWLGSTHD